MPSKKITPLNKVVEENKEFSQLESQLEQMGSTNQKKEYSIFTSLRSFDYEILTAELNKHAAEYINVKGSFPGFARPISPNLEEALDAYRAKYIDATGNSITPAYSALRTRLEAINRGFNEEKKF